jgi:hypothetical protein
VGRHIGTLSQYAAAAGTVTRIGLALLRPVRTEGLDRPTGKPQAGAIPARCTPHITMDDALFAELLDATQETAQIMRGEQAPERLHQVMENGEIITLSREDYLRMTLALLAPPPPTAALRRAARRYRRLQHSA